MSNSFKSVEKKYFAFSRTIRFVITVLYPIMFLITPIEYKFLLPFIWLLLFLGGEWLQEIYLHRIIVVPLGSITDTAQKLANLDFMTVCDIQSNDELGSLSNSLNTLASNLQNALDELNKANKQLEKDVQHERILLEQRKELVDSLSHEMKTPLGLIQAYTEGLKNEIDNDKRRKYMDAILAATERMNYTIISLLDLSALEAGTTVLKETLFDFVELTEEVGGRLLLDVPCERYNFTYELPEREIIVYADRRRIEQVLENLISNAKKYVCENGNIHLAVKQENSTIYFSVFNQGNTIPEQEISQIWSKFYRGKWTGQSGNGLGLAIVSKILTIYQVPFGAINHTDGVEFYFQFPIANK